MKTIRIDKDQLNPDNLMKFVLLEYNQGHIIGRWNYNKIEKIVRSGKSISEIVELVNATGIIRIGTDGGMYANWEVERISGDEAKINGQYYERIGHASYSRSVYLVGDVVVKIDNYEESAGKCEAQCKAEYEMWERIQNTEFEKFCCPVLYSGKCADGRRYNIMPYIDYVNNCEISDEHRQIIYRFEKKYHLRDISHNTSNRCVNPVTNELMIIDYGLDANY